MIKTFPIHLDQELHEKLRRYSFENNIFIKDFILAAIIEKLEGNKDSNK